MLFRQLLDETSHTYTYLIADEQTREAAIIDPCIEKVANYLQLLKELNLRLKYSLETHVHADHITGSASLRVQTGCLIGVPEFSNVQNADRIIKDNETIFLNKISIQAIATPGHTDSHLAYYINQDRVMTGDALFIRSCGRTDFQCGDPSRLYDSVTQRLFSLPDNTLVYPGHDYNGNCVSTIGEEKQFNIRLAHKSREQFIEIMENLNLPMPQKMAIAVPANLRCGEGELPEKK